MSILKVANVHFDTAGTNRIDYVGGDNIVRVTSGAIKLPVGDTAGRPGDEVGLIRYNSQLETFEGRNGEQWGPIGGGGGATGAGSDEIFWENGQNVTANYTVTAGRNAGTFGPITINENIFVTIPANSTWSVV